MTTTFKINANDINLLVLDTIKAYYAGKEIEISIKEYTPMPQTELTTPSPICNASNAVTKSHAQKIIPSLDQQLTRLVDELRFPILAGLVVCGINLNKFVQLKRLLNINEGMFECYEEAQKAIDILKEKCPEIYQMMRAELFKKIYKVHSAENQTMLWDHESSHTTATCAEGNVSVQCVTYSIFLSNMAKFASTKEEYEGRLNQYIVSNGVFE